MKDLSTLKVEDTTCVVCTFGLNIELARHLAQYYKKVYLYNFWERDYSTSLHTSIGKGFTEFELIDNVWDLYDKIDLWIFPEVNCGAWQQWLERQGKLVWGSREGELMEMDRWEFIQFQIKIGMNVPKSVLVTGTDELRKEIYKSEGIKFVKMNARERGDNETFKHKNEDETEICEIRPMEQRLGNSANTKQFIIQDAIEADAEIGYDGFCVDGQFPETTLFGIEAKDTGYVGMVKKYEDLPDGVKEINSKLVPALKKYGYRCFFHTEIRIDKEGKPFLIDMTCRAGYPPINTMMLMWDNMAECILEGAKGNLVDMQFNSKVGLEIELFSETAKTSDYTLFYPDILKPFIKQPYIKYNEDRIWVIPQESENKNVGSLVCVGNSFDEITKLAEERASQISGHHLSYDLNCLNDAITQLKKL